MVRVEVDIGRLHLKNPVITASGTFGYGEEYSDLVDLNRLGAIVAKGISLKPMDGNPPPRICETPCGMLNSIGLQNVGIDVFIKEKLPFLRRYDTRIIANILGNTIEEYVELAMRLDDVVDAIELNISCPNVQGGGIAFGRDLRMTEELIFSVRKAAKKTLITKLSPNVSDIGEFAKVSEASGSDALSLINTVMAMSIDIKTRRPRLFSVMGGLSGPAIRPIAVRMVWEASRVVRIPVIGMGGIMKAEDAIEFLLAGATAIAVGTANFVNPRATIEVIEGIEEFMEKGKIDNIKDLIGGLIC